MRSLRTPSGSATSRSASRSCRTDPELVELSEEAEAVARGIVPKTVAERELANEGAGESA